MPRSKPFSEETRKASRANADRLLGSNWTPPKRDISRLLRGIGAAGDDQARSFLISLLQHAKAEGEQARNLDPPSISPVMGGIQATAGQYLASVENVLKALKLFGQSIESLPVGFLQPLMLLTFGANIPRPAERDAIKALAGALAVELMRAKAAVRKGSKTAERKAAEHAAFILVATVRQRFPDIGEEKLSAFVQDSLDILGFAFPDPGHRPTEWNRFWRFVASGGAPR